MQRILKNKDDTYYATALARRLENDSRIPPTSRLCGALLKNFGGFASENWRTGDWWWGRVDAAAALAHRLGRMPLTEHEPGVLSPRAFADLVSHQFYDEEIEAGASPAQFNELVTGREGGLDSLDGNYRVSIVHRALRLAVRSFYRVDAHMKPLVIGVAHLLLMPVLVFLPAAVQWPRLISAAGVLLGGVVMARASTLAVGDEIGGGTPTAIALALMTVATLALMVVGGTRTDARWRVLSDSLTGLVDGDQVASLRARARWRGYACGAGGLLALGVGWLSWWWGDGPSALLYGGAAAVLTAVAAFVIGRGVHASLPAYARGPSIGFRVVAALSLGCAALAPLGSWASRLYVLDSLWAVWWVCSALFFVGVLLCWGVVGLPRAAADAQAADASDARIAGTPKAPPRGAQAHLSSGMEIGGMLLALIAAAAAAAVLLLGASIGEWQQLNGWFWVFALLVWANVLWCIPAWLTLETRAWTDDSIFRRSSSAAR